MSEQQLTAFWRWKEADGTEKTAPFIFEDSEGEFRRCFERYLAPRWRRDFPTTYAAWAAEASRNAAKPTPYLNLPEPPLPELNVLYFPCVASQYAHIAAIFNVDIPVGQKVDLVSNIPLWRQSSLFFGADEPKEEKPTEYVTTLYVATRRDATEYPAVETNEPPEEPADPETPAPTTNENKDKKAYVCILVDWRYFARSVPYTVSEKKEKSVRFFDRALEILETYQYLGSADVERVKTVGICSDKAKRTPSVPLDSEVFAEGASLTLLLDAALFCRGAYLYNGEGVEPTEEPDEDSEHSPRYPAQVGFPTIDLTDSYDKAPKYVFPDYWTPDEQEEPASIEPAPDVPEEPAETPSLNDDKSISLTCYVDVPAVLIAPEEPEPPEEPTEPTFLEEPEDPEPPEEPAEEETYVVQNLETLKRIARYVNSAVESLSALSSSATFWLGERFEGEAYRYIPNGGFNNEQNSLSGLNSAIWFPIYGPGSKPWDSKHGQIDVSKTKFGPFRYKYGSHPVEWVKNEFYSGWRLVGPLMDAENLLEASNSVIGVQGNGVSLGFEPVVKSAPESTSSFDLNGVTESRIVKVSDGTYEVYYAADVPAPIGCGAVVNWLFENVAFNFSAANAAQGWSGAAYGELSEPFTQNEARDALASVALTGEDQALKTVVEAAGDSLASATYKCYSPFSKSGDTMASGTRVCVVRNSLLKRFEIIQAECD